MELEVGKQANKQAPGELREKECDWRLKHMSS